MIFREMYWNNGTGVQSSGGFEAAALGSGRQTGGRAGGSGDQDDELLFWTGSGMTISRAVQHHACYSVTVNTVHAEVGAGRQKAYRT